jgi:hypothetical protein
MALLSNHVLDRMDARRPAARRVDARDLDRAEILRRAKFLLTDDRRLVELSIRGACTRDEVGEILGITAGSSSRRLRRVLTRLNDPISVALLDPSCPLPDDYRQLGIEHFVQGRSMSALAELHRMTRRAVMRSLEFVRGWHRGLSAQRLWDNVGKRAARVPWSGDRNGKGENSGPRVFTNLRE